MSHHKRDRYGSAEPITLPRPFPTRAPRSSLRPNVEIDELLNNTVVAVQVGHCAVTPLDLSSTIGKATNALSYWSAMAWQ